MLSTASRAFILAVISLLSFGQWCQCVIGGRQAAYRRISGCLFGVHPFAAKLQSDPEPRKHRQGMPLKSGGSGVTTVIRLSFSLLTLVWYSDEYQIPSRLPSWSKIQAPLGLRL